MARYGKTGRPHKGPRTQVTLKLPDHLYERVQAAARDRGIDRNTLLTEVVATWCALPNPFDVQEALQLTDAA